MNEDIIESVLTNKVIAIVRGIESKKCMKVAEALYAGGIRLIEITYNQSAPESWEDTARTVGEIAKMFHNRMFVGAGTVTNTRLVDMTADAGGRYVISPDTNTEVIHQTKARGLLSIPGAMTPTEVLTAHRAGADFVKLFPASDLGVGYLKSIRAPISHVRILATGGISDNNAKAFLDAGAAGLGVGGALANKAAIESGEYEKLTEAAERFLRSIR